MSPSDWSPAVWGFVGTIVGGAVTLLATWLQQFTSSRHAAKERRRAYEIQTLRELRELVITASCDREAARYALVTGDNDEAAALMVRWAAADTRMLGIVWSIQSKPIRDAVVEAFRAMMNTRAATPIDGKADTAFGEARSEENAAYSKAQRLIGERLQELA